MALIKNGDIIDIDIEARSVNVELTDEQLSVNNGYYYLCKGKCMTSEVRLPGVHTRITIAELSEKILDEMQPYMSLMMN